MTQSRKMIKARIATATRAAPIPSRSSRRGGCPVPMIAQITPNTTRW